MSIQSIQRAFDILRIIDAEREPARAATIAKRTNLPRTTVIRMLATLEEVGAVSRIDNSNYFRIGTAVRLLGQPKTNPTNLKEIAQTNLRLLAQKTGETAYLCLPVGEQVYYLEQINSQHHILLRDWTDTYFPHHATAAGKVFLAFMPPAELDSYLEKPLEHFTPKTITDPQQIRAYVAEIQHVGYGWTHEQTEAGLVGVAAPIFDRDGNVVAAVSLGGPAFRFPKPGQEQETAQYVVQSARQISERL